MKSWLQSPFVPKFFSCLVKGYSLKTLRKDCLAGVTVGLIALPLAMAFAIASGVEPSRGLYTAVIAGFLISLLGGSKVQIGGPTGAFVVIVYSTIERHGYNGLVVATLMAAVILILMGLFRVGQLIRYVPYPLIIGFTAGLAVLVFTMQVKDFFGFSIQNLPPDFLGKWALYFSSLQSIDPKAFLVGGASLGAIVLLRRFLPSVPWGIVAIGFATALVSVFSLDIETIGSRYGEIPHKLQGLSLPQIEWNLAWFQSLLPDAMAIALLAGLESLLSALMGDRMSGGRHKSDCELMAQGIANAASVLFGGIPATGTIARTAANVKTGARTPVSGIIHALTVLVVMMACAPFVSRIPLAGLAAVLMVVAWNMAEMGKFVHLFKAPRGDMAVMLTAFTLTVLVDLSFAVQMAMMLALFLFMKRMSEKSGFVKTAKEDAEWEEQEGVEVYELKGPLFFGMADRIRDLARPMREQPPKVCVLRMRRTSVLDASGMHALSEFAEQCQKVGTLLVLSGVHEDTKEMIAKFGLEKKVGTQHLFTHTEEAMSFAKELLGKKASAESPISS